MINVCLGSYCTLWSGLHDTSNEVTHVFVWTWHSGIILSEMKMVFNEILVWDLVVGLNSKVPVRLAVFGPTANKLLCIASMKYNIFS